MSAPSHANISITIGGKDITISHKNFSNIKLKRKAGDVCNNFTLQILDEDQPLNTFMGNNKNKSIN